jgi:Deoxyribonuclease NucA/NucB
VGNWKKRFFLGVAMALVAPLIFVPVASASATPVLNDAAAFTLNVPSTVLAGASDTAAQGALLASAQRYDYALADPIFSNVSGALTATPTSPSTALSGADLTLWEELTANAVTPATRLTAASRGGLLVLAFEVGALIGEHSTRFLGFKDDQVCEQHDAALTVMSSILDGVDCRAWDNNLAAAQKNLDANQPVFPKTCVGTQCWTYNHSIDWGNGYIFRCFSGPTDPVYVLEWFGGSTGAATGFTALDTEPSRCGSPAPRDFADQATMPVTAFQFMVPGQGYATSPVETVGDSGPDPVRLWKCEIVTNAGVYSEDSDPWSETDATIKPIVCPAIPAGEIPLSWKVTELGGPVDQLIFDQSTTVEYQYWRATFAECNNGSCPLILRTDGQSCFETGTDCDGWIDDPNRATKYSCTYGTHAVSLNLCYSYGPTFNLENRISGHAYGDPLTGAVVDAQNSPTDADQIVSSLLGRTWLTNYGFDTEVDRAVAARTIAVRCLDQVNLNLNFTQQLGMLPVVGLTKDRCKTMPIFAPGTDVYEAAEHDLDAINSGQPSVLHAMGETEKNSGTYALPRSWTGRVQYDHCGPNYDPPNTNCDEYPFYSTMEGGPGASLRNIYYVHNQFEGTLLGGFVIVCGLNGTPSSEANEYVVVPHLELPSIAICRT